VARAERKGRPEVIVSVRVAVLADRTEEESVDANG
jgi:hypothetical protein